MEILIESIKTLSVSSTDTLKDPGFNFGLHIKENAGMGFTSTTMAPERPGGKRLLQSHMKCPSGGLARLRDRRDYDLYYARCKSMSFVVWFYYTCTAR